MIPIARTEQLLVEELGEEVIVYDRQRDAIYCLNSLAARVWYCCDGRNTIEDIRKILAAELELPVSAQVNNIDLVSQALQELESFHLIAEYISQPIDRPGISRRRMLKKAALVSGFAMGTLLPTIKSIVAPLPAMASSGDTTTDTTRAPDTTATEPDRTTEGKTTAVPDTTATEPERTTEGKTTAPPDTTAAPQPS